MAERITPEVVAELRRLLAESDAAEAALRPERRDLFMARLDASNRYLNALYAAGPALLEALAARSADAERIRALEEALRRIDSDHVATEHMPAAHIYAKGCDACARREIARAALNPTQERPA